VSAPPHSLILGQNTKELRILSTLDFRVIGKGYLSVSDVTT
jgi:hypothetical protein